MRKFGWGGTLALTGLFLAAAIPANAAYVLTMTGPATATPGSEVRVSAVLSRDNTTDQIDSMIWDLNLGKSAGAPTLVYLGYLFDITAFQTGGADDFSNPKGAVDTGRQPPGTAAPASVHFEALTRSGPPVQKFTAGTLATLDFTVPANAVPGQTYDFTPQPDTFADGFTTFDTAGAALRISIVPEPATLMLLGLGGLAAARRRLLGA